MNIVIIEDEQPASERLAELLKKVVPSANIIATHDNVQSAWRWFQQNPFPDLVMLDVQLADGTAFDLLKLIRIDCPVIFTTAYNKYAVDAFKENSIAYLLKPVKKADLELAMQKLSTFQRIFSPSDNLQAKMEPASNLKKRFIIRFADNIKTLSVDDIAYCFSENKVTFARAFDGMRYPMDYTLDMLEKMVDPTAFFRINRQYLINLKAIKEMKVYSKSRIMVHLEPSLKEYPLVSTERMADFKLWLSGDLK